MGALIYAGGVMTGLALMLANNWSVRRAVERERRRGEWARDENRRLREEIANLHSARDCADAFRHGKEKGRMDPMGDAERFARAFEGRRVQFRGAGQERSA